jgi:hypothetical protein
MHKGVPLAVSAMLWLVGAAQGAPKPNEPKECPVTEGGSDAIEAALRVAESCVKAREVFTACAYVASGDVGFGEAVIERCEKDFLGKLGAQQRKTYDTAIKRCWSKYRRESGTMYRSFEAMCAADVAVSYAKKSAKGPAAPR